MKLLVFAMESDDVSTDSAAYARGLVHQGRLEGLTIEVASQSTDDALVRFEPDILIVAGTSPKARETLAQARARRIRTVIALADLDARNPLAFENADAVLVPSKFASRYYAETLGLHSTVGPTWVGPDRAIAGHRNPRFVTFVDPSAENGAYVFARIADELGRARPDIPLLIVGTRGSGATLATCGINVFAQGNVHLMERTSTPDDHWQVTRLALIPSLAWDASPQKLAEAMSHGIPAVASDRGALPEFQEAQGASLAIPDRITPTTRTLPTPDEVAPWVEAIARLWDTAGSTSSPEAMATHRVDEPRIEGRLREFFRSIIDHPSIAVKPFNRSRSVVLVPYFNTIERACEQSLRKLEEAGVTVVRSEGCPQIDVARNALASDALNRGAESIFFIDADLGFDPLDALRLLARPEPVISGVYTRKRRQAFASVFAPDITEVIFGANAPGPYPLQYAAGGFLRIKANVLVRMITELNLPTCNTAWGRRDWPFFQPLVASTPDGKHHYLGEDWAFSHRLHQIGITPQADTTVRLWHLGPYPYGWEDAGTETTRHSSYRIKIEQDPMPGATTNGECMQNIRLSESTPEHKLAAS
jgi:Glycosyl transferases group 1